MRRSYRARPPNDYRDGFEPTGGRRSLVDDGEREKARGFMPPGR